MVFPQAEIDKFLGEWLEDMSHNVPKQWYVLPSSSPNYDDAREPSDEETPSTYTRCIIEEWMCIGQNLEKCRDPMAN